MQINGSPIAVYLPIPRDEARERPAPAPLPVQPPAEQAAEPIERPVEEIERAQELFERRQSRQLATPMLEDARARRALETYEAVQHGQERAYVSTVLGIDEYA
ncbi:MAG: hypothetical protein JXM75_02315 [Chromatiaceae bacterium]|nr:hypothetical protein [Chromatiaceae bacterium]